MRGRLPAHLPTRSLASLALSFCSYFFGSCFQRLLKSHSVSSVSPPLHWARYVSGLSEQQASNETKKEQLEELSSMSFLRCQVPLYLLEHRPESRRNKKRRKNWGWERAGPPAYGRLSIYSVHPHHHGGLEQSEGTQVQVQVPQVCTLDGLSQRRRLATHSQTHRRAARCMCPHITT